MKNLGKKDNAIIIISPTRYTYYGLIIARIEKKTQDLTNNRNQQDNKHGVEVPSSFIFCMLWGVGVELKALPCLII